MRAESCPIPAAPRGRRLEEMPLPQREPTEGEDRGLVIHSRLVLPEGELQESASRSRGPGGQHGDKASTRVTLRWSLRDSRSLSDGQRARLRERLAGRLTRAGAVVVHADEHRSRARNRAAARARLAELLRAALRRPAPRRPTKPTRASRERVRAEKRRRSEVKRKRGRVDPSD